MRIIDERIMCVVFRNSTDETTFAIVSCRRSASLTSGNAVRNAISAALTEWFATDEGRSMWDYSSANFNVGDLSTCDYTGGDLGALLEKHGVVDLDIEVFSHGESEKGWSYDTVLGEEDGDWQERLDEAMERFNVRQTAGEVITCSVCDSEIPPDEGVDPCFKCCAPMCNNCSTSGPRCRGCG